MTDTYPEFQGFPKISRFYRDIIITEKIDGTNAQVLVTEDGQVLAGSRKRWLRPGEDDNYGFRAWTEEHTEELLQLGPGRHCGEWWGQGIQRNYNLDHKRFSLFNVSRWLSTENGRFRLTKFEKGEEVEIERIAPPACCRVVPILHVGPWPPNEVLDILRECGSFAAPGFRKPEGIVIFHISSGHLFKVTLENDESKGYHNGNKR